MGVYSGRLKRGVLGTGTARKRGVLGEGPNRKKGVLGAGQVKKGGSLPRHIHILNIYVSTPPPPPPGFRVSAVSSLMSMYICHLCASVVKAMNITPYLKKIQN